MSPSSGLAPGEAAGWPCSCRGAVGLLHWGRRRETAIPHVMLYFWFVTEVGEWKEESLTPLMGEEAIARPLLNEFIES